MWVICDGWGSPLYPGHTTEGGILGGGTREWKNIEEWVNGTKGEKDESDRLMNDKER